MFTVYRYLAISIFIIPLSGDVLSEEYVSGLNFCT